MTDDQLDTIFDCAADDCLLDGLRAVALAARKEALEEVSQALANMPTTEIAQFASTRWNAAALTKWLAEKVICALAGVPK